MKKTILPKVSGYWEGFDKKPQEKERKLGPRRFQNRSKYRARPIEKN
jgi:hypothetical protein